MKKLAITSFLAALLAATVALQAQEQPKMPPPEKEHGWLQQLVGEWESQSEMVAAPGQPAEKCKGNETVRSIGGFWTVAEMKGNMPGGISMTGIMTLGFDPQKKKYIGTWIDSTNSHMWSYVGTLDPTGKILALDTEGPDMTTPGKTAKYRDTIELKSKDERTLTSSTQDKDGKWTSFMTVTYRRKG